MVFQQISRICAKDFRGIQRMGSGNKIDIFGCLLVAPAHISFSQEINSH
jgi:hypothetical protein